MAVGDISRRSFLAGAGAAGAVALGAAACGTSGTDSGAGAGGPTTSVAGGPPGTQALGDPSQAPFDTVVVLMMENRSFDHVLGWLPGANGKQEGLTFVDG